MLRETFWLSAAWSSSLALAEINYSSVLSWTWPGVDTEELNTMISEEMLWIKQEVAKPRDCCSLQPKLQRWVLAQNGVFQQKKKSARTQPGLVMAGKTPQVIQDFILHLLQHTPAKPKSLPCPKVWSLQRNSAYSLIIFIYMDIKIKIIFNFLHFSLSAPVFPQGWLSTYLTSSVWELRLDGL